MVCPELPTLLNLPSQSESQTAVMPIFAVNSLDCITSFTTF
ncbi:3013_t:CDS:2 [Cetraspora pellucida]|uniref:3013_t:CDS:1 n=1 Tax=Cetraspora pellucida TaxID=1433469 RepID=A0A9N9D4B8_9GLOM|nr:3013_t:CDS:2 [Cetraspora pellucida]